MCSWELNPFVWLVLVKEYNSTSKHPLNCYYNRFYYCISSMIITIIIYWSFIQTWQFILSWSFIVTLHIYETFTSTFVMTVHQFYKLSKSNNYLDVLLRRKGKGIGLLKMYRCGKKQSENVFISLNNSMMAMIIFW